MWTKWLWSLLTENSVTFLERVREAMREAFFKTNIAEVKIEGGTFRVQIESASYCKRSVLPSQEDYFVARFHFSSLTWRICMNIWRNDSAHRTLIIIAGTNQKYFLPLYINLFANKFIILLTPNSYIIPLIRLNNHKIFTTLHKFIRKQIYNFVNSK